MNFVQDVVIDMKENHGCQFISMNLQIMQLNYPHPSVDIHHFGSLVKKKILNFCCYTISVAEFPSLVSVCWWTNNLMGTG